MEDEEIIDMFLLRNENAIKEVDAKYHRYFWRIAMNILNNNEDSEECVNDTYLHTWNSIPPTKPKILRVWMGKITRNLSLNYYEKLHAKKRGSGEFELMLDELAECIPDSFNFEKKIENQEIANIISVFLLTCKSQKRIVFIRRYYYGDSINDIAEIMGIKVSKVKNILFSIRKSLKECLIKEGIWL